MNTHSTHRSLLAAFAVVFSIAPGIAQRGHLRSFEPIPSAPRFAGVYHLATGSWTRGHALPLAAGAGSEVVYNNTSPSGYYAIMRPGEVFTAPGRLPSTTSLNIVWNPVAVPVGSVPGSAAGCADEYTIDGFEIAYCSETPTTSITMAFHESWSTLCASPVVGAAQGGPITLTGLPGSFTSGSANCWTIVVDLAGSMQSFTLQADGDGTYLDNTSDAFAWSFSFPTVITTERAGMLIAGAPADGSGPVHPGFGWFQLSPWTTDEAAGYDGTRFDGPPGSRLPRFPANGAVGLPTPGGESGTDAIGDDAFRLESPTRPPGCYFFGGPIGSGPPWDGPYANFHLELYAKVQCPSGPVVIEYCAGDGIDPTTTMPCPCFNYGAVSNGCASSFNPAGAHHTWTGSIANDSVVLHGTGMNPTGNCIFLKGDSVFQGGTVFGDGIRCADGNLIRLRATTISAGAAQFPDSTTTLTVSQRGGTPVGSGLTGYYLVYYRNAAAFCTPATFNATNGTQLTW